MNNCVSKNSADFKSLYKEVFGIDNVDAGLEQILAVEISSWQDENGLDKWPLASDMRAQMTGQATMAYIKDKTSGKGLIKPDVAELFESNPELANSIYEALGFTGNISLESNLKNTGKTEQELIEYLQEKYPEIKLNISNNPVWEKGDNVFNQEEYNNQVNYRLRATEILLSDKAKQVFAKGDKNGWDLNKILTELAIPKGQKQLLLELGVTDREQLALELAGKYGYTIEINTATIKEGSPHARNENEYPEFEYNGEYFTRQGGYFLKDTSPTFDNAEIIFTDEYFEALEKSGVTATPSKYYSNLTVPGGTNYTENEISIPLITPSIKGHALFSTDKGIGWFRSDDKAVEGTGYNPNELYEDENGNLISGLNRGTPTKTRRILEVQSDLFQKGRDKKSLTETLDDTTGYGGGPAQAQRYKESISSSQNKFLQLLNKDNNWVTFFIKSIIQDSAKKGYEKVLFPKGETAAKIEGHQTIADEINTKNEVITQLKVNRDVQQQVLDNIDNDTENFISGKNKYFASINTVYTGIGNEAKLTVTSDGKEEYNISTIKDKNWKLGSKEEFALIVKNHIKKEYATKVKDLNNRIEQLEKEKQELKSQGIEKLKPIEAFYEIKVGNILEKTFGKDNVKTVTDEYGNQWREITINQARDLSNILLQRDEANRIIGQANIKAMTVLIDAINQKQDTLPHEYAHHYIAWFRDTPIVQEAIKKWGSEEALVQSIGEQVVKQKGEAYNWWNKFVKWIMNQFNSLSKLQKEELTQILTDAFLTRQDLGSQTDNQGFKEFVDPINQKQNTLPSREYQSDFFKGLDPYQREAKKILYDFYKQNITDPNDSMIDFYNEQLRKLSESVGDEQWYLRLSKNNKWYVAGYKNGSVTHPDYFSIYAEQRYTAWNRSRYYEEFNRKHSIGAAKDKIRSVIYSNKVNALLDNIQQAFPGLPIIRETKETTKAKGHKSSLPGWMDADGYHINMDNIHPGVFVHEIAHMFRAILKTVNPTAYKELESKLDDYISENPNWYEAYLRKHPNQSDDVTRDEILAIIAGSVSEDKIAHFLSDNDVEPTNTERKTFRQRVKEIFDAFWSAVRDFFSSHYGTTAFDGDLSNMTLEEIYMGITDDIIAGREIRHISPKDMEIISYEYQESGNRTFQESPKNNLDGKVNVIENVGDIPNIIINNPNRNVITDSNNDAANNPELFVNAVFMRRQTLLNNTGSITWLGKRFDYENLTDDQIKTFIRTEILPYHLNVQERFIDDIRSAIELVQEGNEISYAITKTYIEDSNEEYEAKKRSYIKVNELQKLLTLIGAMDNIKDVLSLSEFMSKYSNLGLVDPRMVGLDPLVIVHENTDKSISISISDITAADLSSQGKFTGSRNKLNGRFVNNVSNMFDMDSSKITWSNNKRDARAAALTFTLAAMNAAAKKNNIHLDIRRAGVFSMQGGVAGHIYSRTIHDYQDAFDQVKELFAIPEMRGLVSDNATSIIETLNNDQAWDAKDLYCDHIFELRSYYNSQATVNNIPDWYRDDLLGINMSKKKHIEVLRARQKQIETQRASISATAETDYEYQAISKAIYWYNQGVHVNNMSLDDISSGLMKRIINPHNLGNGIVDYATIQFEAAKSMVVNKANLFTDELSKYIKASMKSHGKELIMENIISMNPASEIFDRLFPKIEAIVDKPYEIRGKKYNTGDKVTVSLSNEIYCSAHPNINKALKMKDAKGNALLTKEDVALADFIVKTVREQYVEALLNRNRYNKKYTIEDAIEELNEVYLPYTLPVIRATQEQNIRAGAIKTFFGRFLDKMVNQGINWGDLTSTEFSEINDRFFHQRSYTKQLEAMGLELVNGEYRVNNLESLFNISNNLEYTMKIFVMDSERKRIYDDHVTPILNDCFAIANYADKTLNKSQDNTKEFLREYYNLIALHKRKDDYLPQGIVKSTAPVVRTLLQLHTFISIAYRPLIWIKSAYFNESAQWLYGIANSAADWGITTGEKLNMPGADHMAKAHRLLFGSKADYKKIWKLANKMQLINGNERDVLENVFSNIADKHLFKQQLAHLGNWYTDAAARALTMVSYMLFDGSYDAHIYNPKTGELTYDVTKDERFYKNGKKIEGWDLVHDRIVEKQTTQGLITDGKQQIGYDFEEINKRIKWYADKFIIGSMDIHQKALLGNQFAGAAVGQFRGFSIDKIWNDIAIGKIKSTYGGRLVPYKDENGEWVTVEEQIEMESNLQSLIGYLWDFRKLTKGINNWKEDSSWNNLSPIRRRNLVNVTVRLVVMGAIIMAIKALRMSDRDRRKVEWLFSELFMYDTIENIFDNPVPVFSSIEDMYKIILGKKRFAKIYRYMGPVNDAVWIYELASANDEVAKHVKTEKQKAKEKKEREEKKELERLKKQKALEKYGFIPDEYK